MPFKTRARKEKSNARFAVFVEGAKVSYGQPPADQESKTTDFVPFKQKEAVLEEPRIGAQIIKIGVLALLVIGLQIILKVSHIGL